jgi:hypothetical protein
MGLRRAVRAPHEFAVFIDRPGRDSVVSRWLGENRSRAFSSRLEEITAKVRRGCYQATPRGGAVFLAESFTSTSAAATAGQRLAPVTAFPLWIKFAALAWVLVWIPTYTVYYGWTDFLHLSDIAIAITAIGLWTSSPLLLSSQAISTLVAESIWTVDVAWAEASGRILIPGVEYMWKTKYPLWLRLMSFYHTLLPVLLLWALWRVGYNRRGLKLQAGILAAALVAGRLWGSAEHNINFSFRDPFFGRAWGPAPVHLFLMFAGAMLVGYLPTDWLLARLFTRPRPAQGS